MTAGTREWREPPIRSGQPGSERGNWRLRVEVDSTNDVAGAGAARGGCDRGGGRGGGEGTLLAAMVVLLVK